VTFTSLRTAFSHPLTQRTRVIVRRVIATLAVAVAVVIVTAVTIDLGPSLKAQAESQGSRFIERPMRIGRLGVRLWSGQFELDDLVIEGLTPQSPPFLTVKRLRVGMPWSTLFSRRIVLSSIDMDEWKMFVEQLPDGKTSFPGLGRGRPRQGRSASRSHEWTVQRTAGAATTRAQGT